jgi:hypothetical protein
MHPAYLFGSDRFSCSLVGFQASLFRSMIGIVRFSRILIDGRSSINILYRETMMTGDQ